MTRLFVDQLTVIDFSYFHAQRGIVGESWIMDVELAGELDENGMVFDFAHVKKQIKAHVDGLVDHKLLFPIQLTNSQVDQRAGSLAIKAITDKGYEYRHTSPAQAVALIDSKAITIDSVTPFIEESLKTILPRNVTQLKVNLREESIQGAYYHYSHGLKKHFGDCQRIAHGHRSKIHVLIDGERSESLERKIANQWQDIYLITEEDITQRESINNQKYVTVAYSANQGEFELTLPESVCDVLTTDSTVELIAEHLLRQLKPDFPNNHVQIKAFEGVQKGAIAEA